MNHKKLKKGYISLYKQMMKYIWSYYTIELLAELEVAVCNVFPIMTDVRTKFQRLQNSVREQIREDDEMKKAFDDFNDLIQEEVTYANISVVVK